MSQRRPNNYMYMLLHAEASTDHSHGNSESLQNKTGFFFISCKGIYAKILDCVNAFPHHFALTLFENRKGKSDAKDNVVCRRFVRKLVALCEHRLRACLANVCRRFVPVFCEHRLRACLALLE